MTRQQFKMQTNLSLGACREHQLRHLQGWTVRASGIAATRLQESADLLSSAHKAARALRFLWLRLTLYSLILCSSFMASTHDCLSCNTGGMSRCSGRTKLRAAMRRPKASSRSRSKAAIAKVFKWMRVIKYFSRPWKQLSTVCGAGHRHWILVHLAPTLQSLQPVKHFVASNHLLKCASYTYGVGLRCAPPQPDVVHLVVHGPNSRVPGMPPPSLTRSPVK